MSIHREGYAERKHSVMKLLRTLALPVMLTCGAGAVLAFQQSPNTDVPQQSPGTHNPDAQQEKSGPKSKSGGKSDSSSSSSENDIQNGGQPNARHDSSSKKTKKPHNPQGHGPQHHDPNGQS
jgi:cytoskeletal protein RodZ